MTKPPSNAKIRSVSTTTANRRARERAERRQRIIDTARALAETDGWYRVTTRRLAEAIEYSQPVLYSHFPGGKPEIMTAVALQGFREIAVLPAPGPDDSVDGRIRAVATGYLDFAAANPAVYEAMFTQPITASFATDESPPELTRAFETVAAALDQRAAPTSDRDTAAELFWSMLHGVATLEYAHRLRSTARQQRIDALVALFAHG